MNTHFTLPDWNTLAALPDEELPLLGVALLVARDEYPQLDAGGYDAMVEDYARALRPELARLDDDAARIACINRYLFGELGFAGNHDEYDDPRNSYLNEVFERRLGIPLSLAIVQIELARRLEVPLDGISFPGHFLVRMPMAGGIVVMDPFNGGRPLGADELKARIAVHMDGQTPDDRQLLRLLEPASHRAMLVRMLRNLKGLYRQTEDWERLARTADRILCLDQTANDALRDRGMAYLALGHASGARADLSRYLEEVPAAQEDEDLRAALVDASRATPAMH